VFVTEIQKEKNRVVLGRDHELTRDGMWVSKLNMVKYADLVGKTTQAVTKSALQAPGTPASSSKP
jgi:tRNA-specific 2-thiouridylase